jgi:hypothetical protein
MTTNHTIKIFDKSYVNFQRRPDDTVPLGFMTYYETNAPAAFNKRKSAIDYYASYTNSSNPMNGIIVDNTPMIGFRISRSLRRLGWHNQNTVIRIEDPRGFDIDITIANMIMLTDNNLLENGEILRECVWGRDGNVNVLLPVNSSPYMQAVANTARNGTHVNVRTVQAGDHVILKNGKTGRYMGSLYGIEWHIQTNGYRKPQTVTLSRRDKKFHYIRTVENQVVMYHGYVSPNISSITTRDSLTKQQVNELVLADVLSCHITFDDPGYFQAVIITNEPAEYKGMQLIPMDLIALQNDFQDGKRSGYRDYFYGIPKANAAILLRFGSSNLAPQSSNTSRYVSGVGHVNNTQVYGTICEFDKINYSITHGYNDDHPYDPNDIDFFLLEIELELPKLNQILRLTK